MCTFAETRCGGFEASAARGYLHAWLANTGTLPASYTIVVTDCRCECLWVVGGADVMHACVLTAFFGQWKP